MDGGEGTTEGQQQSHLLGPFRQTRKFRALSERPEKLRLGQLYYITDRTQIRQIKSDKNLILYYFTATRPIQSLQQLHGRR